MIKVVDGELEGVPVPDPDPVPELEPVELSVPVSVRVLEGVVEAVCVKVPVMDGVEAAVTELVVDAVKELVPEFVLEGVPVTVRLCDPERVPDTLFVEVSVPELVDVRLGDAVTVWVGVLDVVMGADAVWLPVPDRVLVLVPVPVAVSDVDCV